MPIKVIRRSKAISEMGGETTSCPTNPFHLDWPPANKVKRVALGRPSGRDIAANSSRGILNENNKHNHAK
jgi:hypothetical protein